MIFSSIKSKDIPWRAGQKIQTYLIGPYTAVARVFHQVNQPNRRLVKFRCEVELHRAEPDIGLTMPHLARVWIEQDEFGSSVTEDEFEHSQKVLARLAILMREGAGA